MKKLLLSLVCAVTGMVAMAQNFTVTGTVMDVNSNPVSNQAIYIYADSTVFNYYNVVYSDASGYFSDVIPNGAQVGPNIDFYVSTTDNCNPNNWVTVTLSNQQGSVNSGSATFTTCANSSQQNCYANFYGYSPNNSTTFNFVDMSYGSSFSYTWDFGDGNVSSLQNPTHTYAAPGTYTVCLIATSFFCSDTICQSFNVASGPACQANFYSYNDTVNDVVYLVELSSSQNTGMTFFWDFGDGNTSTQQYPVYTYANYGAYLVCLTITDNTSCTSTYCDSVVMMQFAGGGSRSGFTINVIPPAAMGVEDLTSNITAINVYPNPTEEMTTVEYDAASGGNHRISIVDVTGKLIFTENYSAQKGNNRKQFSLNGMDAGMYLVTITDENGMVSHIPIIKK